MNCTITGPYLGQDGNYARTRAFYQAVGFKPLEEFKQIWDAQKLPDHDQTALVSTQ